MGDGAIARMPVSRPISFPTGRPSALKVQRTGRQITSDGRPGNNRERDMSLRSTLRRCV